MTAKEAREISKNPPIEGELNAIYRIIEADARQGKMSTWFFGSITDHAKDALEKEGYRVVLHWWGTHIYWREIYDTTIPDEEKEDKE